MTRKDIFSTILDPVVVDLSKTESIMTEDHESLWEDFIDHVINRHSFVQQMLYRYVDSCIFSHLEKLDPNQIERLWREETELGKEMEFERGWDQTNHPEQIKGIILPGLNEIMDDLVSFFRNELGLRAEQEFTKREEGFNNRSRCCQNQEPDEGQLSFHGLESGSLNYGEDTLVDTKKLIPSLLKPFVEYLKSEEPVVYADHGSLWIDLGWDVSQGEGEIVDHVKSLMKHRIKRLPSLVRQFLWWETIGGGIAKKNIMSALQENQDALDDIEEPDCEEQIEDIIEDLSTWLFLEAETAYDEYVENEYAEDEEDSWEDEDEEDS